MTSPGSYHVVAPPQEVAALTPLDAAPVAADLLVWSERAEPLAYRARTNDLLYRLVVGLSCGSIRRP
jgi:hypothetical protein